MHLFSLPKTGSRRLALISVLALAPLAGLLGGCAESRSNLLPGNTVEEISGNLDLVRDLADSGDCLGALDSAQQVTRQIEGLGTAVDARLKRSLRVGASRLVRTIQQSCEPAETLTPPAETTLPDVETSPNPEVSPEGSAKADKPAGKKPPKGNTTGSSNGNGTAGGTTGGSPDTGTTNGGTTNGSTGGTGGGSGGTGGNTGDTGGVGPPGG